MKLVLSIILISSLLGNSKEFNSNNVNINIDSKIASSEVRISLTSYKKKSKTGWPKIKDSKIIFEQGILSDEYINTKGDYSLSLVFGDTLALFRTIKYDSNPRNEFLQISIRLVNSEIVAEINSKIDTTVNNLILSQIDPNRLSIQHE